jgi:FAD/FMN-containing dehydrogenase
MIESWSNWSGSVACRPRRIELPAGEAEVAAIVRTAASEDQTVRVCGSGHSFQPLCATNDVLISLDALAGIESADSKKLEATILAGTKIHDLGEPLRQHAMALANQGDIDVQSLAGAISTGTHGTGRTLGNLSTQAVAFRLVTAEGETLECSADDDPELLSAVQVSLGALGVVTAIRLRLLPAYRLHERMWQEPIEVCLDRLDERIGGHHHFEFFWYPAADLAHAKALDPTQAEPDDMPNVEGQRIDHSDCIFPTVRENRFNEMEYSLPAEEGPSCFREIRELMRNQHGGVTWPVEYRTIAADRIDLSPAYGRETIAISIHQAADLDHRPFFADAEPIFRAHGGRPHWGKIHSLRAADLSQLYPRWSQFQSIRQQLDPGGRFLNDHLRQLFVEG